MAHRDPHPNPLLPPPIHTDKKLVIVLTNAPRLEKSNKPTGFDIRELAHVCEILFYYFSRTPSKNFPPVHEHPPRTMTEPIMDWNWVKEHLVIASLRGGEAPLDPTILEDARKDFVTKEFMSCTALMDMIKSTTRLTDVDPTTVYGVIVCGGHGCLQDLAVCPELGHWLYTVYHQEHALNPSDPTHGKGGVIATICHGTAALLTIAKHGEALREPTTDKEPRWIAGKKITVFSDEEERQLKTDKDAPFLLEDRFRAVGAKITNGPPFEINVVQDDRLITAQNNESTRALTRAFIHTIYKEFGSTHPRCNRCP